MSDPMADATNLAEERKKRAKGKRMPVAGPPDTLLIGEVREVAAGGKRRLRVSARLT